MCVFLEFPDDVPPVRSRVTFWKPLASSVKAQLLSSVVQTFPGLTSPWGISTPGPFASPVPTGC